MVSAAEVKSILGIEGLSPPELIDESTYRAYCGFDAPTNPLAVSVIYNTNATPADYDLERNGYVENGIPVMDLTDFGDAALTSTLGRVNTVFVLDGTKMVQIVAVAPLDKVRTLTELYLERL
jgi:hypothetical protein